MIALPKKTIWVICGILVILAVTWLVVRKNRTPELLLGSPAFEQTGDGTIDIDIPAQESASAYINQGVNYYQSGKLDKAQVSYQQALAKEGESATVYRLLGNIARDQGKYDDAIAQYIRAVELEPSDTKSIANLATIYMTRLGNKEMAIRIINDGLGKNEGNQQLQALLTEYQILP